MPQQGTNPKVEELRFRLKTDPKSRLFYQLAEELRKIRAFEDAEQVLRSGLNHHPTYLAAWVSLGRTLREEGKHRDAVDAFAKALQIDPGNAVAARLMADAYVALGDKVEAIKKYKLVRALMPADVELDAIIERLDDEINPVTLHPQREEPLAETTLPGMPTPATPPEAPFVDAGAELQREHEVAVATADVEPMREAHDESPFEEPAETYTEAAAEVEQPLGMHVEPAPLTAEMPAPWPEEEPAADVFAASTPPAASAPADDVANTVTMADLYVQQGHFDRAQSIYESILDRDPNNDAVRAKLDALDARSSGAQASSPVQADSRGRLSPHKEKVDRLESWLAKVKRV